MPVKGYGVLYVVISRVMLVQDTQVLQGVQVKLELRDL